MEEALRDMLRWAIGFTIVSTIYLLVGFWLIRRWRRWRTERRPLPPPAAPEADQHRSEFQPDSARSAGQTSTSEPR